MQNHPPPVPGSRIAVVGGTGFLGAHIVAELAKAGYRPVVIARRPEMIGELLPQVGVDTRRADVSDKESLFKAFAGCAAVHSTVALVDQAFASASADVEARLVRTNVEGALNVLHAAAQNGIRRVLLAGSCSMRYQRDGALASEDSPPTDLGLVSDAYVRSKLALGEQGPALADALGITLTITMPGALFGPGDRVPSLFGETIVKRLQGGADPSIEGGMPLVDIRDVARAHVRAMQHEQPSPYYLLVAETISTRAWQGLISELSGAPAVERFISPQIAFTMARLAEAAAKLTGQAPRFTRNTIQHVAINQSYDCARAQEELSLQFNAVADTLRDTIAWFREHGYVDGHDLQA